MTIRINDSTNLQAFMDGFVLEEAQKIGVYIDTALVLEMPKDTTAAASSVNVSLSTNNDSIVDHGSPAAAISDGNEKIKQARPYVKIIIQDMQPYIGRLNDGHSLQAPRGFIDRIFLRAANL